MQELKIGDKAPEFEGILSNGNKQKLKELLGPKGLILYFYPKDSTPGCTTEACDFRDHFEELKEIGYNVVGISKDGIKSHQKFTEKHNLNFELISDELKEICNLYGVWREKKMMGKTSMGIVRSTFVIDKSMKIVKIYNSVKVKDHVKQILEDVKEQNKK
ncbi:MAG: thioredoxin-dependent thiol peroxidase [Leptospiraceae bacterium]|nr:thioredoxin-dependent thiol peroxidase [Leptospiraceae bacterium]MCP5497321.1 thioredoxin-dependent thiol peroxidase [Leptospiraceae bacterium]